MPGDTARLMAPPAALRPCLFGAVVRDTRGLGAALAPEQRLNRFPALPFCGITWILEGGARFIEPPGHPDAGQLPATFLSGPQTGPFASVNDGSIHTFCLVFHAPAMGPLSGVAAGQLRDRHRPLEQVLPTDWQALDRLMRAAPDDEVRLAAAAAWLAARWLAVRGRIDPRLAALPQLLRWATVQVSAAALGWTTRHLERRSRDAHCLSPRELRNIQRGHDAVIDDQTERLQADAAVQPGQADQPHMSRDWRRLTGVSPAQLRGCLDSEDESWWLYRLRRQGPP